ncbi:putative protein OS=Tsukamurella paurometabola (strain ATCC 8368 / DSM / CCUG 35730 /CIP 100753 / JCM 10117 / KCTC 9821 / NBRC 16120 / NCIMB 702349/ NCTC 13040) OX=521096 GN=Tpau_0328 PE=4 SV=1 [Tsukamurella paurometabola]|uniref:Uncharacterized protein n=1 Tax=Tsukamurella paurometabola (strain ATCC 8368 / DSM 20162 / CCUG 35730 / CIP 100753 / JCM 10117 / KCTC 9821 / NBRC 16120 / NCIMB 702349 / NCTC 13040) TaxID=521096 RepID=D5URB8_TSUPD|nr:hypothetical protein [Tsukamurella paurometabola]ADG76971.1 hypothetical protein Tpau_0328 [Tsukamurella paurometabola DSM 20162]SUP42347.1 Uncharacterised protein [Tsukamurella paurometabola]
MIYEMNTAAHAAGTATTEQIAQATLANIKFVRTTAEAYAAANSGQTSLKAVAHMHEIIAVCDAEQKKLENVGISLKQNNGLITNTDMDGGDIFQGYIGL